MLTRAKIDLAGATAVQLPGVRLFSQRKKTTIDGAALQLTAPDILSGLLVRTNSAGTDILPAAADVFAALPSMTQGDSFDLAILPDSELTVSSANPWTDWEITGQSSVNSNGCAFVLITALTDNKPGATFAGDVSYDEETNLITVSGIPDHVIRNLCVNMSAQIGDEAYCVIAGVNSSAGSIQLAGGYELTGTHTIVCSPRMELDIWFVAQFATIG